MANSMDSHKALANSIVYSRSGFSYQSARSVEHAEPDLYLDFISFLAVAQKLEIDFLPITWQTALDEVGRGGTATIRQLLINLQMSFAFKRVLTSRKEDRYIFRELINEISVLGHPSIGEHPNIVSLEGICWDVLPYEKAWKVRPVLVFEKTQLGDLRNFADSDPGSNISVQDRLKLCNDVALALRDMQVKRE